MKITNQWGTWDTETKTGMGMVTFETFVEKFLDEKTVNHFKENGEDRILTYQESKEFFDKFLKE